MHWIFIALYNFFEHRKGLFFAVLLLSFAGTGFLATRVKLEEDVAKMLPKDKQLDRLSEVFTQSRFMERIVVTISLKDTTGTPQPDSLTAYAEALSNQIKDKYPDLVGDIQTRMDEDLILTMYQYIQTNLPIFLDDTDYQRIDSLSHPDKIKAALENDYHQLTSPAGWVMKKVIADDPLGYSFLALKKLQQFQYDDNFEAYDGYILTKDMCHLMMFITPAHLSNETGPNAKLSEGLDQLVHQWTKAVYPNMHVEYFGAPLVAAGNATRLRADTILTLSVTLILLLGFIYWFFRKKRAPLVIMLPVVFGALFSLACIYLIRGHISLIALGAGSLILGIAINYSLHFFTHYKYHPDVREVIRELTVPMTIGGATTIGAFLALQWVQSEILKDLGLFAAFSLIGASLASLIFLPHFLGKPQAAGHLDVEHMVGGNWLERWAGYKPEYNKALIIIIVLLTPVLLYFAVDVRFDEDMNHLNYMSADLKTAQDHLNTLNAYALQSVYVMNDGVDLEHALRGSEQQNPLLEQLKKEGVIKKYVGISSFVLSDSLQRVRIEKWNQYWTPQKKQTLLNDLNIQGASFSFRPAAFTTFEETLNRRFDPAPDSSWNELKRSFLGDYIHEKNGRVTAITIAKVNPGKREAFYKHFEHPGNMVVVDKQYLTRKFVEIVRNDFNLILTYSSLLVFFALLIVYGRIELTLITFLPMLVTWIWILGIMRILGIEFNIINIILSTLIFGLGDDYSIFVMEGLQQEYRAGKKVLSTIKTSIILSAITTIIGLGVLALAKHPAIHSLALISIIGIVCVLFISQTLEPFLFRMMITNRTDRGLPPFTLFRLFKTVFAFVFFVVGCLLMTLIGLIIIKLNPIKGPRTRYVYHWFISKFTWSLTTVMANVKKQRFNPGKEDFVKPAVIIANHQSFLDILYLTQLSPKLLLLTNQWVWNSPVFGAVVRMADYYPVAEGVEESTERLEAMVKEGYSIVVFPEGTRAKDGVMKRFHKGAFFLAEHFNLDIIPIVLHGTGYTMTKGDFLLKDGQLNMKILPRIPPTDTRFGNNYAEKTKGISRFFKEEFKLFSTEMQQPAYFREQLIHHYLFKGPVLEWYLKIKTKLEYNYVLFNDLLPKQGSILDLGCGYGFLDYILYYCHPERKITGVDYDEEKIETAAHSYQKPENLQFYQGDVVRFPLEKYDGIVISDMLHYLQPDQQNDLMKRAVEALLPGGVLLIRDGNKDLKQRQKGTWLSELFSTKIIGFNKTADEGLNFLSATEVQKLLSQYQDISVKIIDTTKYTSNIIFLIQKENFHANGAI